jgi:hypothetical protein
MRREWAYAGKSSFFRNVMPVAVALAAFKRWRYWVGHWYRSHQGDTLHACLRQAGLQRVAAVLRQHPSH